MTRRSRWNACLLATRRVFTALVGLLLCGSVACGRSGSTSSAPSRPSLQSAPLPDMSAATASVQERIRAQHSVVARLLERPDSGAAELSSAFGRLGKLFVAAELYDSAATSIENARRLAPTERQWPYLLGHVARYQNDPTTAARWFEAARVLAPDDVPTLVWLAEMRLALNQLDEAAAPLARALALQPDAGAVRFAAGKLALARQEPSQAVMHLERALAAAPQASSVRYPLAMAYRALGNREKAEEHLRLRGEVPLAPGDPVLDEISALLENAAFFESQGSKAIEARDWAAAVGSLRRAAALAPQNALTHLNLGTALYMQGDGDAALSAYREALQHLPSLAKAHFGVGVVLEARGRDAEAIPAFTAALQHDPSYVEARFSLANALRRNNRVAEALPHYEQVLASNPAVSQASFGLAMSLVRLGRYREAVARLEAATQAFPDQLGFPHALARLLAAAPDDGVRNGPRAQSLMAQLVRKQQTLAMAETMAMVFAEQGRFDDAVRWQRDAIASAEASTDRALAARLRPNLQLYLARRPCRTPWAADDPVHRPVPAPE